MLHCVCKTDTKEVIKIKKDDMLHLRIPAELKEALKKDAAQNERSLSGQIIYILKEYLKSQKTENTKI